MDLQKESRSRDSSREDSHKNEAVKEGIEDRTSRLVAKANPLLRAESSRISQPSVSSGVTGRHSQPPSLPTPPVDLAAATPDCPTPRLRRPPPRAEVDPMLWAPQVTPAWLLFPGAEVPVFGWFREGASPYRDAFFASDGTVRNLTRDLFSEFRLPLPVGEGAPRPRGGVILHNALHRQIVDTLECRDFLRDPRSNSSYPIASERDWRRISHPGSSISLDYRFPCTLCGMMRLVRRTEASVVDSLPIDYQFRCEDVGVECAVSLIVPCEFVVRQRPSSSSSSAPPVPVDRPRDVQMITSNSTVEEGYGEVWRKRMKFWAGITVYDGSASLVELRGWKATISEAYRRVGVPEGRDQVLQATKYLSGDAEKWWRSIAGQPRGQGLAAFEELYQALEQRFIPRSVFQKAIRDWNSLKQTGSAEEYMRRVDELATVQPLGEVAEFWHAWEGMRPELKAEVQFRLQEQGRQTCPREELWTLLWNAETRYPLRQVRLFPSRPPFKSTSLRAVTSTTPTSVCWICDAQGHRANVCPKRLASGCARCGSKAHDLVACPQRPDLRRTAAAKPNREGAPPSGRKNKMQQK